MSINLNPDVKLHTDSPKKHFFDIDATLLVHKAYIVRIVNVIDKYHNFTSFVDSII